MKKTRLLFTLLLASVMALSVAGCTTDDDDDDDRRSKSGKTLGISQTSKDDAEKIAHRIYREAHDLDLEDYESLDDKTITEKLIIEFTRNSEGDNNTYKGALIKSMLKYAEKNDLEILGTATLFFDNNLKYVEYVTYVPLSGESATYPERFEEGYDNENMTEDDE